MQAGDCGLLVSRVDLGSLRRAVKQASEPGAVLQLPDDSQRRPVWQVLQQLPLHAARALVLGSSEDGTASGLGPSGAAPSWLSLEAEPGLVSTPPACPSTRHVRHAAKAMQLSADLALLCGPAHVQAARSDPGPQALCQAALDTATLALLAVAARLAPLLKPPPVCAELLLKRGLAPESVHELLGSGNKSEEIEERRGMGESSSSGGGAPSRDSQPATRDAVARHAARAADAAALAPAALRQLTFALQAAAEAEEGSGGGTDVDWPGVVRRLLGLRGAGEMLEACWEGLGAIVRCVRWALLEGRVPEETLESLCFSAGASMELTGYFVAQPALFWRLVVGKQARKEEGEASVQDPLPSCFGPVSLILSCLALHDAPLAAPPFAWGAPRGAPPALALCSGPGSTARAQGGAELLAARGLSLLMLLSEHEPEDGSGPGFMDAAFGALWPRYLAGSRTPDPGPSPALDPVLARVAVLLGQTVLRPSVAAARSAAPGEGQLALNCLRAAELLADDSNSREAMRKRALRALLGPLMLEPREFAGAWCGGEAARKLHDETVITVQSQTAQALTQGQATVAAARALHRGVWPHGSAKQAAFTRLALQFSLETAIRFYNVLVNLQFMQGDQLAQSPLVEAMLPVLKGMPATAQANVRANLKQLLQFVSRFAPGGDLEPSLSHVLVPEADLFLGHSLLAQVEVGLATP